MTPVDVFTVACAVLLLLHAPPLVGWVNVVVEPTQTLVPPEMPPVSAVVTVTVRVV